MLPPSSPSHPSFLIFLFIFVMLNKAKVLWGVYNLLGCCLSYLFASLYLVRIVLVGCAQLSSVAPWGWGGEDW